MTKSDIVKGFAHKVGITLPRAEVMVNELLGLIELALVCGEDVKLHGFGKFEVRNRNPVKRTNPRTGVLLDIPAKKTVGFKPSPLLKGRVNGNGEITESSVTAEGSQASL